MLDRRMVGAMLAVGLLLTGPAWAQKRAPDGAKVLLLSGGARQHHGYREQAFYLAGLLEDTGRYEVTINEDAEILETPVMDKYDVLIVITDRRDDEFKFNESQQRALLEWVQAGHGYVSIHGANNAAPDWLDDWREMLGGVFSHDTSGGRPDSQVRKGDYTVKIAQTDHPITEGLSDFQLQDELYYNLQMEPGVEPLATIQHDGEDWPVAWTRDFGQGKVFHTVLGHRDFGPDKPDPLQDPNLGRLVLQGVDWVVANLPDRN